MIDFDGATDDQKVSWGNQASLSPSLLTVIAWIDFDSVTTAGVARIINQFDLSAAPVTDRAWIFNLYVGSKVLFAASTTGVEANGIWTIPITTGTHCIAITFDFSSVTNNPVFYVDGASVVVTELTTPTGAFPSGTANLSFSIGDTDNPADTNDPFDGRVINCAIFNRILTPAEILDAYNSRLAIPNYNGLVFTPDLRGAAGGVGDGSTLAAGNVIRDHISGASGVPTGSPVLRADNYLNYK